MLVGRSVGRSSKKIKQDTSDIVIFGNLGGLEQGGHRIYCSTNIIQEIECSVEHTSPKHIGRPLPGLFRRDSTI